ncbi:MAG: 3-deoxy-manno-octulosonate cytidylyltransferase [Candidatus Delongbacteria bacterium]|nr:3-deoxy-manno-octulosonate cytidylyltransferase [Candidatus Delongbacteria bacterium]
MSDFNVIGVIPARYSSTRFPGKPLAEINGKSMVLRVVEQAEKCKMLNEIIVATDDERISNHLMSFNKKVILTNSGIRTGTDRCFEAIKDKNFDIVVNIQGDEPLLNPDTIDRLILRLAESEIAVCSTPVKKIEDSSEIDNKNIVKVVFDNDNFALYFSCSRIPFNLREYDSYYKHIGIYAYKTEFLKTFVKSESTILEKAESLEQLRILENGYKIKCVEVFTESLGVDTKEDLEKVKKIISERSEREEYDENIR